jgi:hypothetical protein
MNAAAEYAPSSTATRTPAASSFLPVPRESCPCSAHVSVFVRVSAFRAMRIIAHQIDVEAATYGNDPKEDVPIRYRSGSACT